MDRGAYTQGWTNRHTDGHKDAKKETAARPWQRGACADDLESQDCNGELSHGVGVAGQGC